MIERIKIFLALFEEFTKETKVEFDGTNKKNTFQIQLEGSLKNVRNYYNTVIYGDSWGTFLNYIYIKNIKTKKHFILDIDKFSYAKKDVSSENNIFYSEEEDYIE